MAPRGQRSFQQLEVRLGRGADRDDLGALPDQSRELVQGWCVDKIDYIWKMHDIKLTVDMCDSKKKYKGVWLDGPCTAPDYDGVPCARSITVDIATGSVMKQYKGPSPLEPLC